MHVNFQRLKAGVRIAAAVLYLAGSGSPAFAQNAAAPSEKLKTDLQSDLDAYLKDRGSKEHLSSLSLSVSLASTQPTLNVTSGTTTYGGTTKVTPASLYQIGSNTKAFTAVAVLQLEAQGRLSIDAPIGAYLPQYPAYAKLTLRRLLNMTSGLDSYDNTPAWEKSYVANPAAKVPADTLIRLIYPGIKYQPPGSKYAYSNTGYLLAQEVVAARSKSHSFEKEMARIIESAGLHDTYYTSYLYAPAIANRVVAGYYENDDAYFGSLLGRNMTPDSLSWAQGAGSIVSTPSDLIAWARALYVGNKLLPERQHRELLSLISLKTAKPLASATAAEPAGFGLGVAQRYDQKNGAYWFYQGETLGFRAVHLDFPKSGLIVAVFANSRPTKANSHLPQLFATLQATIEKDR
jgi:D-alanyl-D-alanine carboxypeptidase